MGSLKNLKQYNERNEREDSDSTNSSEDTPPPQKRRVYVTEHLPAILLDHKKKLLPAFKSARKDGKRTRWAVESGTYCLYVNGVRKTVN